MFVIILFSSKFISTRITTELSENKKIPNEKIFFEFKKGENGQTEHMYPYDMSFSGKLKEGTPIQSYDSCCGQILTHTSQ